MHTPLKSRSKTNPFTPGPRPLGLFSSSSSAFSNTWGSISSFDSDLSSSTSSTTPEPDDWPNTTEAFPPAFPKTPSKPTSALPDQNVGTSASSGRIPFCPPIILRKDIDIDYVPISPKKPKVARVDTLGMPGMALKVRELRELSTGSRSMPILPNLGTPTRGLFGTPRHHGHDVEPGEYGEQKGLRCGETRTAEEKKEILGGMLGNVDALVEGVRKAGIWGLG